MLTFTANESLPGVYLRQLYKSGQDLSENDIFTLRYLIGREDYANEYLAKIYKHAEIPGDLELSMFRKSVGLPEISNPCKNAVASIISIIIPQAALYNVYQVRNDYINGFISEEQYYIEMGLIAGGRSGGVYTATGVAIYDSYRCLAN